MQWRRYYKEDNAERKDQAARAREQTEGKKRRKYNEGSGEGGRKDRLADE